MVHSCADFVNLPLILVTVFFVFLSVSALGSHEMGCMFVRIRIIIMHNYYYYHYLHTHTGAVELH